MPIVQHPKAVQLNDIKIYVVNKSNYEDFIKAYEKKNGGDSYIAISVKDYENLSLNFAELRRYIEQQKQIIVYYEEAVKPEEKNGRGDGEKVVSNHHPADTNGDGVVDPVEHEMYLEFKRKELEDADAMRDAQRTMAWFSLGGMLLYPAIVLMASIFKIDQAAKILGDMAGVYFIAVAGIVAAFFGAQAISKPKSKK